MSCIVDSGRCGSRRVLSNTSHGYKDAELPLPGQSTWRVTVLHVRRPFLLALFAPELALLALFAPELALLALFAPELHFLAIFLPEQHCIIVVKLVRVSAKIKQMKRACHTIKG